jgi:hypothetical protein
LRCKSSCNRRTTELVDHHEDMCALGDGFRLLASDFKVTARPAAVALGALTMAGRNNQDVMAR